MIQSTKKFDGGQEDHQISTLRNHPVLKPYFQKYNIEIKPSLSLKRFGDISLEWEVKGGFLAQKKIIGIKKVEILYNPKESPVAIFALEEAVIEGIAVINVIEDILKERGYFLPSDYLDSKEYLDWEALKRVVRWHKKGIFSFSSSVLPIVEKLAIITGLYYFYVTMIITEIVPAILKGSMFFPSPNMTEQHFEDFKFFHDALPEAIRKDGKMTELLRDVKKKKPESIQELERIVPNLAKLYFTGY